MVAWMRILIVELSNKNKKIVFGANKEDNLNIEVSVHKYLSALKDNCNIKINNLTYDKIIEIIDGGFFNVIVKMGYEKGNFETIFNGEIIHITNSLDSPITNTILIKAGSKLVARFSQKRITLGLNSNINFYSALRFVSKMSGIPNPNISTQLKKVLLTQASTVNDTFAGWLNKSSGTGIESNADSSFGSTFSMMDIRRGGIRKINLNNHNSSLINGYPKMSSNGLKISMLPTASIMTGDIVRLDNSLINIYDEQNLFAGIMLDPAHEYFVMEVSYDLQNRGRNFKMDLTARAKSMMKNLIGATA